MPGRRDPEMARRAAERRQREDDAPRLLAVAPRLRTLQIAFSDGEGALAKIDHVRHVMVARAPALFTQRCANPSCKEGEHELTPMLLAALKRGEARIEGEDPCLAPIGTGTCPWVLRYVATASYEPSPT
jgi:hypothetical protein